MTTFLLIYLGAVNVVSFLLFVFDLFLAKRRKRRIPEKLFFRLAWIGGAVGIKLAQVMIRHKIRSSDFTVSLHLIILVQVGLVSAIWAVQFTNALPHSEGSVLTSWLQPEEPVEEEEEVVLPKRFGPGSG